jgi:putative DNA primase/helicase
VLSLGPRALEVGSDGVAAIALQDLASPVAAFVRDRCERGPKLEVPVNELYTAWRSWTDDNGHVI